MYEDNTRSASGNAPRATLGHDTASRAGHDTANQRTDPKFARESFTMRRMLPWQIVALAVAAAIVVGLIVFYV
jgi:hypothetical protein